MGQHLSPRYGQVILVSGYLFWQLSIDHNVDVQSVSSWAPKVVRKYESKHWLSCGADGRRSVVGVRSRDYQFFWDGYITLAMGLYPRAREELRYNPV